MDIIAYVLIAFVVLALVFAKMSIVIISQSETKIIERLGKYYAILLSLLLTMQRILWHCVQDVILIQTQLTCVSRCTTLIARM